jgi:hypothetical protein
VRVVVRPQVLQQARYHLNHDMAEQLSSQQNTDSYTFQSRPLELNFQKSHDYSNCTWLNCLKLSCCFGVQGGSDGGVARTAGHYVTTQKHVTAVSGIKTCKAALKDELKPEIQAQRVA